MTKKFFTKVSPRAVDGIRRMYEQRGAEVHAKLQNDGTAIVVVTMEDDSSSKRRRTSIEHVAA